MRIGIDLRWLQRAFLNSPEGALGGAGMVIWNLWRGLSEAASGHQLVALLNRGARPAPLAELLQGAEAHAIGVHGLVPPLDRKWKYLNACNWLETDFGLGLTLRSLRLDVLHMTDHVPPPRFACCPTVSTLHEYFTEVRRGWPLYRYLCDGMRRASCVVAVSRAVAEEYTAHHAPNQPTRVVHNGIDLAIFRPAPPSAAPVADGPYLTHAGVMTGRKNPHGVFEALARLRARRAIPRFVSVGPYDVVPGERGALEARAREAGVADSLVVLGRGLSAQGMANLYRGSLGLVFPSLHEGFGLPAAEALACGVPVVVSRAGGLPEVAGDLGIYVDPKDPDSIADGIERMLTDEAHRRRVAEEGPRRAAAFSYQAMAQGYLAVYEAVAR